MIVENYILYNNMNIGKEILFNNFMSGQSLPTTHQNKGEEMTKSKLLISGQRFHNLVVLKLEYIKKKERIRLKNGKEIKSIENIEYYKCQCDCGNQIILEKRFLTQKAEPYKTCGCGKYKHNKTNTRLFKTWQKIKERCYNPNCKSYKNYGGRGIVMCEEWKNDFISFYNWAVNNGWKEEHKKGEITIDRINNNGNYEPNNCRFVDMKQQNRNRNNNRIIEYNNQKYCVVEFCEKFNLNKKNIYQRLSRGWSIEKILLTK